MKLIEFIDKINNSNNPDINVTSVLGETIMFHFKISSSGSSRSFSSFNSKNGQYPLIFFSLFLKKFKAFSSNDIMDSEVINLALQDDSQIKSKLATTFLGQKKFYWLEDVSALKAKCKSSWVEYLKNYNGPNVVAFYSNDSVSISKNIDGKLGENKIVVIDMDSFVDQKMFLALVQLCSKSKTKSFNKTILDLFSKNNKLTLDISCLLIQYASLAGRKYKEFCDSWLNKIITPEKSLFTLSQYFFAKNPKIFFKLWLELRDDYPEQFWIVYWSEQVWRASNVIKLMHDRKIADARKISFRLPFSFMQRSWRNFTSCELVNAHGFLYSIDYSLKNGGDPFSLDLFYSKFLSGEFQNNFNS